MGEIIAGGIIVGEIIAGEIIAGEIIVGWGRLIGRSATVDRATKDGEGARDTLSVELAHSAGLQLGCDGTGG